MSAEDEAWRRSEEDHLFREQYLDRQFPATDAASIQLRNIERQRLYQLDTRERQMRDWIHDLEHYRNEFGSAGERLDAGHFQGVANWVNSNTRRPGIHMISEHARLRRIGHDELYEDTLEDQERRHARVQQAILSYAPTMRQYNERVTGRQRTARARYYRLMHGGENLDANRLVNIPMGSMLNGGILPEIAGSLPELAALRQEEMRQRRGVPTEHRIHSMDIYGPIDISRERPVRDASGTTMTRARQRAGERRARARQRDPSPEWIRVTRPRGSEL